MPTSLSLLLWTSSLLLVSWLLLRLLLSPLRHVPGPLLGRVSNLYMYSIGYLGLEGSKLRDFHAKFRSSVVLIGPNSVSVADGAAVRDIYVRGGGFPKDARYRNFDLGPVVTIFSSLDTKYRDLRAKAVAPLFSPARLRTASQSGGVIAVCVADFVARLSADSNAGIGEKGVRTDILDLSARLAIDATTGYLLGRPYGGLREHASLPVAERQVAKLSANAFIAAIVRFGRFSLLPGPLFRLAYRVSSTMGASEKVARGAAQVDEFSEQVVRDVLASAPPGRAEGNDGRGEEDSILADTKQEIETYQGRLLAVGISPAEAAAQSKAVIFAGADSVALLLSTILFHIARDASVRASLRRESEGDKAGATSGDVQSRRPYLRAAVREGLRLAMTNPTRMTRVVPGSGLHVGDVWLPPGTIVGCAPYVLHHDPDLFPDPFAFRPERWLDEGADNDHGGSDDGEAEAGTRRAQMDRNMIPYGAGLRACLGKNLAQQIVHEAVAAVVDSGVLDAGRTCQDKIELIGWVNAEIKGHKLEIEWSHST